MTQTVNTVTSRALRVGDLVEVRSAEEIMATLDERGELENLPFMPEMLAFCGQRLTVHKVAHKLCDTIGRSGMRRMTNAVHLTGSRCDGSAHGGCQTSCSLYWKEAWLRRVEPGEPVRAESVDEEASRRIVLPLLEVNARKPPGEDGEVRYSCQATELLRAAPVGLPLLKMDQYVQDLKTGNATVPEITRAFSVGFFNRLQGLSGKVLPERVRFRGGLRWRFLKGGVVSGRTPTEHLNLQPGELVRIKTKEQILATVDAKLLNRGMGFDEEMSRFCGQTARVKARVTQCIDESTGRMLTMKSPCIILEGKYCAGAYSMNCPREFVSFWREIWLERVDETE
jgi:hypothetical protein